MPDFNYWEWFKLCVNKLKISPSETWGLTFVEIIHLAEIKNSSDIDISLMLNFERKLKGASAEWLQKK